MINRGRNDPWFVAILNPTRKPIIQNILRHTRFELGVADEEHDRMKMIFWQIEELHEGFDVEFVLMQWVLEFVLPAVDLLRPSGLFFASKDPATVVLGFDHKDAAG